MRRRPAWVIRGYHIQGWLTAALLWLWLPPVCPIDATARPPRLPSAKARTRIPRIARARADLGDLRCADNLRCAPPAGPLVDVPFHNELRLFIGEGPLLGDMDIGSSRTPKLLLCRRPDMAFGRSQASVPAPVPGSHAVNAGGATCTTLVPERTAHHPQLMAPTGHERHQGVAAAGVLREFIADPVALSMKGSMQIAPHLG